MYKEHTFSDNLFISNVQIFKENDANLGRLLVSTQPISHDRLAHQDRSDNHYQSLLIYKRFLLII